jgi:Zn-dependent peptidase ImmA (M78 family)
MKVRHNKWLTLLTKELGESNNETAIGVLVRRFRPENESLEAITKRLGISKILQEPLPFEGGVYEWAGERIIKLNSLAKPVRRQFTLAHEVGHLILEHTVGATTNCTSDEQLERACDTIAVELLMPSVETRSLAQDLGKQSPEKLSRVANHFGVSLQVAAQRLHDLGLWKLGMGMWKYGAITEQVWYVGKRPWKTDRPSFSAFELAVESKGAVCTKERYSRGSYTELIAVKAKHIGKNYVLAVVATRDK